MSVVLVAPHLDDVVLSCTAAVRPDSTVVTVFAGDPAGDVRLSAWDERSGATSPTAVMATRRQEDATAVRNLGAAYAHLAFVDFAYRGSEAQPAGLSESLAEFLESAHEIWAPAAVGDHPDHQTVRDSVLALLPCLPAEQVWLYADVPYVRHLAPLIRTADGAPLPLDLLLHAWSRGHLPLDRAGAPPRLVARHLGTVAAARKRGALAAYGSQRTALEESLGGNLDGDPVLAVEYAWRIR